MNGFTTFQIHSINPLRVILQNPQTGEQLPPFPTQELRRSSTLDLSPGMYILYHPSVGYMDMDYCQSSTLREVKQEAGELIWLVFHIGKTVGLRGNRANLQRSECLYGLAEKAESRAVSSQDVDQYAGWEAKICQELQAFGLTLDLGKYQGVNYSLVNWDLHCLASYFSTCLVQIDGDRQIRHFPDTVLTTVPFLYYAAGGKSVDVSLAPHANLFPRDNSNPRAVQEALEGLVTAACVECEQEGFFSLPCGHTLCGNCGKSSSDGWRLCPKHQNYHSLTDLKPQLPASFPVSGVCAVCRVSGTEVATPAELSDGRLLKLDCGDCLCRFHAEQMMIDGESGCLACGLLHCLRISAFPLTNCWKCGKAKTLAAFSPIVCPASSTNAHRLCEECLSSCVLPPSCSLCHRPYSASDRQHYQESLSCVVCQQPSGALFAEKAKSCDCVVCCPCAHNYVLQTLDILRCPGRKETCQYSENLVSTLSQSVRCLDFELLLRKEGEKCADDLRSYEIERSNWKRYRAKCSICDDWLIIQGHPQKIGLFEVRSVGLCGHRYHKDCLAEYLEEELTSIIKNKKMEYPKCPDRCGIDVDGNLIGSSFALVKPETSDAFSVYQAGLQFFLFQCSCQGDPYEIPKDAKFVHCPKGTEHCVTCKEPGSAATHNSRDCLFHMKERLRVDFFSSVICPKCENQGCIECPVGQCPHCLLPTEKVACDQVVCKECGMGFCFCCSMLQSVINAHRSEDKKSLWHRPQCLHYPKLSDEEVKERLEREKMNPQCPQCLKLGRRCDPPVNLRMPHHFSLEEWRLQQD